MLNIQTKKKFLNKNSNQISSLKPKVHHHICALLNLFSNVQSFYYNTPTAQIVIGVSNASQVAKSGFILFFYSKIKICMLHYYVCYSFAHIYLASQSKCDNPLSDNLHHLCCAFSNNHCLSQRIASSLA